MGDTRSVSFLCRLDAERQPLDASDADLLARVQIRAAPCLPTLAPDAHSARGPAPINDLAAAADQEITPAHHRALARPNREGQYDHEERRGRGGQHGDDPPVDAIARQLGI